MKKFISCALVISLCLSVSGATVFASDYIGIPEKPEDMPMEDYIGIPEKPVDDIITVPGFPSDEDIKIPEKPVDMPKYDVSIPEKPEDMPKDDVSIPEKPGTIVAPGYPSDEEVSIPEKPDVCIEIIEPFDDVAPSDYYYDAVMWAVEKGITKGTSEFTFSPDDTCSTNQILTFLWRANGSPVVSENNNWVPQGEYYTDALNWYASLGHIDRFYADSPCSRGLTVKYLYYLVDLDSYDVSNTEKLSDLDFYRQFVGQKHEYNALMEAVAWAIDEGITKGTSATTFSPWATCTRGQIVTFLYRAYANK